MGFSRRVARAPAAWPLLLVAIVAGGCGSSATGRVAATPVPTTSPTPSGPPRATGTAKGDPGLAGNIAVSSVVCRWPGTSGSAIRLFAQPEGRPSFGVSLVVLIQAHSINVRAAMGSGTIYTQREFNGTGVTGFDGARGASVDTPLIEDKTAGAHPGTIGALTSISMSVDCANEQPGTSNVTVTGTAPGGVLSGHLTDARVDCATYPQGKTANITALTQVGNRTVLIIVGTTWMGITVSTDGHYYTNTDVASGSASDAGGHWSGDVVDQTSGSSLHVAGSATCGSPTKT